MKTDLVETLRDLKARNEKLVQKRNVLEGKLQSRQEAVEALERTCREKFGVEVKDLPALIAAKEQIVQDGVAALNAEIARIDAALAEVNI